MASHGIAAQPRRLLDDMGDQIRAQRLSRCFGNVGRACASLSRVERQGMAGNAGYPGRPC